MVQNQRQTKYTRAVYDCLQRSGHATNAELAVQVRRDFPRVSDTTIHRVTQRFYERGQIETAPKAPDGAVRYDFNSALHDHFMCQACHSLKDIVIASELRQQLQKAVDGCCLNGSLLIVGDCKKCKEK